MGAATRSGGGGFNPLDTAFNCAAFAWNDQDRQWGAAVGQSSIEGAEAAAIENGRGVGTVSPVGLVSEHPDAFQIQVSWCSDDCISIARSYDKLWYAWNTNPVSATKAAMYALNKCTQMVCDDSAWAPECKSGQPVCYVRATVCGSEYQVWNYTDASGNNQFVQFGALDIVNDPPVVFTVPLNTVLSMNAPTNGSSIPYDPRPVPNQAHLVPVDPGAPFPAADTTTSIEADTAAAATETPDVTTDAAIDETTTTSEAAPTTTPPSKTTSTVFRDFYIYLNQNYRAGYITSI